LKLGHALFLAAACATAGAHAQSGWSSFPTSSVFCDREQPLAASQQDHLLRFAAVVREQLDETDNGTALISRSGIDLSRFGIRYSHAAITWRDDSGAWSARQLYFACDESRPRIYDQGLAGFTLGMDAPSAGYVSIVRIPAEAAQSLRTASLDTSRALHLLAAHYSANAYPFSTAYQNCNQWVMEMLAAAWGGLADGDDLRARAQQWLKEERYAPEPINVDSHALMFASQFVPLLHLSDHPEADRYALKLKTSLPTTIESFVRERLPHSERIEVCYNAQQIVIHRGWKPIADGCRPSADDSVVLFD
jgi:hypothetical protein